MIPPAKKRMMPINTAILRRHPLGVLQAGQPLFTMNLPPMVIPGE